jgi:nucleoside-diphosphate-sugar epimerase
MKIVHLSAGTSGGRHAIAVFGAGLIGSAVIEALRRLREAHVVELPFDWEDSHSRDLQWRTIDAALRSELAESPTVTILWSAGQAGFMATEAETAAELASFRYILAMTERLARDGGRIRFHLVSSAGALFESQRYVTSSAVPAPRRPYGWLKLAQERLLAESAPLRARRTYRVTSAYGHLRPGFRAGIVSTLLSNAARRAVTAISGRMSTLRDYVFVADVADYIAGSILDLDAADSVECLARARPTSLLEIQRIVEDVIGRKTYVAYSFSALNAEDVTFAPSVVPPQWRPSDIRFNVGLIYREAVGRGVLHTALRGTR